jgi:hypothetical protein
MALRKFLILRRPRSGRLEGRAVPIQPILDFSRRARRAGTPIALWNLDTV